jgi:hypothetical protein
MLQALTIPNRLDPQKDGIPGRPSQFCSNVCNSVARITCNFRRGINTPSSDTRSVIRQTSSCHHGCSITWSIVDLAVGSGFVIPDINFCASDPSSYPHISKLISGWSCTANSAIWDVNLRAFVHFSLAIWLRRPSFADPK